MAFFDVDEFLELSKHKSIQDFLQDEKKFEDCDCVILNWRMNTDNGNIYNNKKPLSDRFTVFQKRTKYSIYKSIIKLNKVKIDKD